ncbi:hypothetical protein PARU111607_15460 [Palleronia rufa]
MKQASAACAAPTGAEAAQGPRPFGGTGGALGLGAFPGTHGPERRCDGRHPPRCLGCAPGAQVDVALPLTGLAGRNVDPRPGTPEHARDTDDRETPEPARHRRDGPGLTGAPRAIGRTVPFAGPDDDDRRARSAVFRPRSHDVERLAAVPPDPPADHRTFGTAARRVSGA